MGLALQLQLASALLSWFFSVCASMRAADLAFNAAHVFGALGIGAAAHISWDVLMAAAGALPSERAGGRRRAAAGRLV
jgi:hypothetical protein